MMSWDMALKEILCAADGVKSELVSVRDYDQRVVADSLLAKRTQPPFDSSAMDGYAVKATDATEGKALTVIGEAPAGKPFDGKVNHGEAVRIFTGGIIPDGADTVIIQENVSRDGDRIIISEVQSSSRHIRKAGIDFKTGEILVETGTQLTALHAGLLAAAGYKDIPVYSKPKVAIFANGDELREVESDAADGIISSTPVTLCQWVKSWGGEPTYLGIARDTLDSLSKIIEQAKDADIIVPLGGASVGDYDLVKTAFKDAGYQNIFSKVAVKPGKPTWFGTLDTSLVLGLPGNPASGLVCARVFLKPLIETLTQKRPYRMGGAVTHFIEIPLANDLSGNGSRALFSRGFRRNGQVHALPKQDSSLLSTFAKADCLIFQEPHHPGSKAGDKIKVLPLFD